MQINHSQWKRVIFAIINNDKCGLTIKNIICTLGTFLQICFAVLIYALDVNGLSLTRRKKRMVWLFVIENVLQSESKWFYYKEQSRRKRNEMRA